MYPCLTRGKYEDELMANAAYIRSYFNGTFSADDSSRNCHLIRTSFLDHTISVPVTLQYLNGVIFFDESVCHKTVAGKPILDIFKRVITSSGIKVNEGTDDNGYEFNGIIITEDLPSLAERCAKYYSAGFRVAKLFTTFKIVSPDGPSIHDIDVAAETLAKYAKTCQDNCLIPLLDVDIVGDCQADIKRCGDVTKRVLATCLRFLVHKRVLLEGTLFKPNIVMPSETSVGPAEMAEHTFLALCRAMPIAVAGIVVSEGPFCDEMIKRGKGTPFNILSMQNIFPSKT